MNRSLERIHHSPLNNSTAKQTYAFPRAPRFNDNSFMSCISRTDKSRSHSPSFVVRRDASPSPGQYKILSFTQEARLRGKGPSICQTQRYKTSTSGKHLQPGPGSYSPKIIEKAPSITIHASEVRRFCKTSEGWVGPASYYAEKYNTVADNTSTRYTSFKNDSRCIFNKSPRFTKSRQEQNRQPGPGQYETFSQFAERRNTLADKLNKMTDLVRR